MPKPILLFYTLVIVSVSLSAQPSLPLAADTLVEVFQHNYFTEQQTILMKFADQAVAYTKDNPKYPDILHQRTLAFRDSIYNFKPWIYEDPLSCMAAFEPLKRESRQIEQRLREGERFKPLSSITAFLVIGVPFLVLGAWLFWLKQQVE